LASRSFCFSGRPDRSNDDPAVFFAYVDFFTLAETYGFEQSGGDADGGAVAPHLDFGFHRLIHSQGQDRIDARRAEGGTDASNEGER
jgi:hypothetical protein